MPRYTFDQLKQLLIANGGATLSNAVLNTLAAIGLAESNGDPNVRRYCPGNGYCQITRNGRTTTEREYPGQGRENSIGLWQINTVSHGGDTSIWSNINANARKAVELAKTTQGLRHWGSYSNGSYRKYLGLGSSNVPSTTIPNVVTAKTDYPPFDTSVNVIGAQNRYLIAFAILVIIFIFAFQK